MIAKLVSIMLVASWVMLVPWTLLCVMFVMETVGRMLKKQVGPVVLRKSWQVDLFTPFFLFLVEGIILGNILNV